MTNAVNADGILTEQSALGRTYQERPMIQTIRTSALVLAAIAVLKAAANAQEAKIIRKQALMSPVRLGLRAHAVAPRVGVVGTRLSLRTGKKI
jgi:hypothetical protein